MNTTPSCFFFQNDHEDTKRRAARDQSAPLMGIAASAAGSETLPQTTHPGAPWADGPGEDQSRGQVWPREDV